MSLRVLLADDHAVLRDGLRMILEEAGGAEVVGEASNGREAFALTLELQPDVVVMDIGMPELNGVEATARILDELPETRVLILSMHSSTEHVYRALKAGAHGYLIKESAGRELLEAVRTVSEGRRFLSEAVTATVIADYTRAAGEGVSPLESLSRREREVFQLVVEGRTSSEIAALLHLSPKTVDTYRSRLMSKLDVHDVPSLVKLAIRHGLIETG